MSEITHGSVESRVARLEQTVRSQADELEGQGTTLEHVVNTIDAIILPTQANHEKMLAAHAASTSEAHDYIVSQKGAWLLIQRAGVVIAAIASVVTLAMKIHEAIPK